MKKKQVFLYGNCTFRVLETMLSLNKSFNKKFEILKYIYQPDLSKISDNGLDEYAKNSDVFIFQNNEGEPRESLKANTLCKLNSGLKVLCTKLWFEQFTLGMVPFYFYYHQYTPKETFDILSKNPEETSDENVLQIQNSILQILTRNVKDNIRAVKERREVELEEFKEFGVYDASLLNFVEKNWDTEILTYTVNHPTFLYIKAMYETICKALSIEAESISISSIPSEILFLYRSGDLPIDPLKVPFITKKWNLNSHEGYSNGPELDEESIRNCFIKYASDKNYYLKAYTSSTANIFLTIDETLWKNKYLKVLEENISIKKKLELLEKKS